jgi:hypothetical protein
MITPIDGTARELFRRISGYFIFIRTPIIHSACCSTSTAPVGFFHAQHFGMIIPIKQCTQFNPHRPDKIESKSQNIDEILKRSLTCKSPSVSLRLDRANRGSLLASLTTLEEPSMGAQGLALHSTERLGSEFGVRASLHF